jgi:hypothetical protein
MSPPLVLTMWVRPDRRGRSLGQTSRRRNAHVWQAGWAHYCQSHKAALGKVGELGGREHAHGWPVRGSGIADLRFLDCRTLENIL